MLQESGSGRPETLLIVDDDLALAELLNRIVERHGYEALIATSVEDARKLYESHRERIALVIADLVMAGSDGAALAIELLKGHPGVRLLVSTGLRESPEIDRVLEAGARGVIFKPYQSSELIDKTHEALAG